MDIGAVPVSPADPHEAAILRLLPPIPVTRIAVLGEPGISSQANLLAEALPNVEFIVWDVPDAAPPMRENIALRPNDGVAEMLETLAAQGEIQAIVDHTGDKNTFRGLFFALPSHGRYILANAIGGTTGQYVAAVLASRLSQTAVEADEEALSRAIASLQFDDGACAIEKSGDHLYKLRDGSANRILAGGAYRDRWGLLASVPGGTFSCRARVQTNNDGLDAKRHRRTIEYPELHLRRYTSVKCYPKQVYSMGNLLLPDTFRRIWAPRLKTRAVQDDALWFAAAPVAPRISLAGTYYALDSELPGHFGHFTTEIIARLWGWAMAKAAYPDVKAVISPKPGTSELAAWQYELLDAAGIGSTDVHVLAEPVTVDRLLGATPMFSNPRYVHPAVTEVWRSIGQALARPTGHRRIFVGRKPGPGRRTCTNADEVERYFRQQGFAVIFPEDHSIAEQISFFDSAEVIVGFAGSGLFNLMFAREPKKVIIIGSESYDAVNEYLIMAATGGELAYFWCEPQIPMGDRWSVRAFMSDYHFDFRRDGKLLDATVDAFA